MFNCEWRLSSAPFDVLVDHSGVFRLFDVFQPSTWGPLSELCHCPCSVGIVIGHLSSAVFDVFIDCSALGYLSHLSAGLFTEDSILLLFFFLN